MSAIPWQRMSQTPDTRHKEETLLAQEESEFPENEVLRVSRAKDCSILDPRDSENRK